MNRRFLFVGTTECQLLSYPLPALFHPESSPEPYATFSGHIDTVQSLACFTPLASTAEDLIFSGGGDGGIFVLRAETLEFIGRLQVGWLHACRSRNHPGVMC